MNHDHRTDDQTIPPTDDTTDIAINNKPASIVHFAFHGTGMAYFKIWIVNLFLTIVTLGFYSPWAKVRRLRYFYGNTIVADAGFDFTANPKRILIGRFIAIAIYAAIAIFGQFSPEIAVAGSLLLFVIAPWLIRSTMRFMARNSQYNNVRFGFHGKLGNFYLLCIAMFFLSFISFGLLAPFCFWMFKRYQFDNTYFGKLKFNFNTGVLDFYKAAILPILLLIVAVIVMVVVFGITEQLANNGIVITAVGGIAFYVLMLLVAPLMQGCIYRAIWGKLTLGENRFELVNFSVFKFALIHLTNYIAIIFSLGLLYPWAAVRLHRYKMQTLSLIAVDDLKALSTPTADDISPIAEEISDVFDFDVSW